MNVLDIEVAKVENTATLTEEQKQEIIDKFIEVFQTVSKAVEEVYNAIKEIIVKLWNDLKEFITKEEKLKKYLKIYNRTNNNRIKKKQLQKIVKLFENYKK